MTMLENSKIRLEDGFKFIGFGPMPVEDTLEVDIMPLQEDPQ